MLRFKKNFGKMIKKASNLEDLQTSLMSHPAMNNEDSENKAGNNMSNETINEFKDRMSKLENMFTKILDRVDKIGQDVKHIKEN